MAPRAILAYISWKGNLKKKKNMRDEITNVLFPILCIYALFGENATLIFMQKSRFEYTECHLWDEKIIQHT
jgi:hypothetical protein